MEFQNRLLGERHRVLNITHHSLHDYQRSEGTKVNRFTRPLEIISNQPRAVNVDNVTITPIHHVPMKSIIQLKISVMFAYSLKIEMVDGNEIEFHFNFSDVTNNTGRPMNASLSEDSVADTTVAKKNSDGKL